MASELAPGSEFVGERRLSVRFIDIEDQVGFVHAGAGGLVNIKNGSARCFADYRDVLAIIDSAGLDPVRTAARKLINELRRNMSTINQSIPNAHYNAIVTNTEVLEALL